MTTRWLPQQADSHNMAGEYDLRKSLQVISPRLVRLAGVIPT
jgi:hypothetical protein